MRRLNMPGKDILAHKKEYNKQYPTIVKKALSTTVQEKINMMGVGIGVFEHFVDEKTTLAEFENILLKYSALLMTEEEIREELEKYKAKLQEKLASNAIYSTSIKYSVSSEQMQVMYSLVFNNQYFKNYFGVGNTDLVKLSRENGFFEQYSQLRLNKLADDITSELRRSLVLTVPGKELMVVNNGTYSIDIYVEFEAVKLDNEKDMEDIIIEISNFVNFADKYYKDRAI